MSAGGGQKSNGSAVPITLRNRPRIPTPDAGGAAAAAAAPGPQNVGVLMPHAYGGEAPVLGALVLSPIAELDGGSVNNTLHAGAPGTAALARAVLQPPPSPRAERQPADGSTERDHAEPAPADDTKRGEVYV